MPVLINVIAGWALKFVGGSIAGNVTTFLAPFLKMGSSLASFVVNFVMGILIDLSKTYEGRIFLSVIAIFLIGWYVQNHYTYIERTELTAIMKNCNHTRN